MLVPTVIESTPTRRTCLRHLLAAAPRADRVPRHRDRRPGRQPHRRPAAVPRGRGPRQAGQPLHQLAGRRHDRHVRHPRHDVVHAAARWRPRASARPRRRLACCSRRAPRDARRRCRTLESAAPAARGHAGPVGRHGDPGARDRRDARADGRDPRRPQRGRPGSGSVRTSIATSSCAATRPSHTAWSTRS